MIVRMVSRWTSVMTVTCTLALALAAVPRDASSTVFSSEGWGWWWDSSETAALGRGGTSVAITQYGAGGTLNPAVIGGADLNYIFTRYCGEITSLEGPEGTFRVKSDMLPNIGGVFKVPGGLRAGVHFRTQTECDYKITEVLDSPDAGSYRKVTEGKGGLSRLQLQLAGSVLARRLALGLGIYRVQGTVKDLLDYDFMDNESADVRQAIEAHLKGATGVTAGAVYSIGSLAAIGGSASFSGTSQVEQEVFTMSGTNKRRKTQGEQELPRQYALGVALMPSQAWTVSGEWSRVEWSKTSGVSGNALSDAARWGIGIERGPRTLQRTGWVLRGGFSSAQYYVETAEGESIRERALALGARRFAAAGRAALDFALQFGVRGDVTDAGAEERFVRLSIGVEASSTLREY